MTTSSLHQRSHQFDPGPLAVDCEVNQGDRLQLFRQILLPARLGGLLGVGLIGCVRLHRGLIGRLVSKRSLCPVSVALRRLTFNLRALLVFHTKSSLSEVRPKLSGQSTARFAVLDMQLARAKRHRSSELNFRPASHFACGATLVLRNGILNSRI